MKSTGMVRRIDGIGRVVIPKELRTTMGLDEGEPMEIYTDGDRVIFRKHSAYCLFCQSTEAVQSFMNKPICSLCLDELKSN